MKGHAPLRIPGMSPTDIGAPEGSFVLVVEGGEASGKNRLAFQAPGAIGCFAIDMGADRAIKKARAKGKEIHVHAMDFDVPRFVPKQEKDFWMERAKKVKSDVFEPYVEAWGEAIESDLRTLVQDTATDIYEMHQAAEFGKLQQNSQLAYGPIKSEYMSMVKRAKRAGKIVVLLHQIGEEYKDEIDPRTGDKKSVKTGRFRRLGMNKVHYIMDAAVRTIRTEAVTKKRGGEMVEVSPSSWETQIIQCKNNPKRNGDVLVSPTFQELMAILDPKTDPAYWVE